MSSKLDSLALGYTGVALSSLGMLIMWTLGNTGYYLGAVRMMQEWHGLFSMSFFGLVGGIVEAAVFSFVVLYAFGFIYNKFSK